MPQQKKPNLWDYLRADLGIDWHDIGHIKFAGGVVGKLTLIAVAAVFVIGLICFRVFSFPLPGQLYIAGGCVVAVILIVILAYWAIVRTTDKHPEIAAIEGMDLVALKLGMGAKGMDAIPEQKGTLKPVIDLTPSTTEEIQK